MQRPIPAVPIRLEHDLRAILQALKENLEILGGVRRDKIALLTDTQERWQDLLTDLSNARVAGVSVPTWTTFIGGISAWAFSATQMNDLQFNLHIPHDYKPNTKIFPHVHWSVLGTNLGTVRWGFEYTVAKGHSMGGFVPTQTVYVEQAYPGQTGGNPTHVITELAEANGLMLDLEPDTVIMVRMFRDAAHANDTQTGAAFAFYADLHYQSDENLTTKRFPVQGLWTKNTEEHAGGAVSKINEILSLLQR